MVRRCVALFSTALLLGTGLWAQGLDTQASKDDWEEINFDFNSSVLVDGFPSLLRLAELLQTNAGYHVRVEGHTDGIGSDSFNQRLGLARANMVRDFLVKYGARTNQIETITRGKAAPKVADPNPRLRPTDEVRYMNRRVVLTVTDDQGRTVGAGGAGDAIRAITNTAPPQPAGVADCCSEVLKRLDKLDDIAKMLKDLADQNAALRKEVDGLRQNQQAIESRLNQPAPQAPQPPSASEVATAVKQQLDAEKTPKFQLLGVNVGADSNGDVTFTGKGRFFDTLGTRFGFQAQAEYYYLRGQREGQADFGLVDRLGKRVQAGLFASFKHVTLAGNQSGGTLGQGALAVDYIFSRGRVGIFGTKGFMDNALINRANEVNASGVLLRNVILERYLKVVDQAGVSATVGLWGKNYVEGNAGYLKSVAYGDRVGGTVRLIFPLNDKIAFTAEGGVNETMLSRGNDGRAVFGVQFGNMIRPKEYLAADHALPMEVPRVRYEIVTRRLRIGNDPPVADAGPDMSNVPPGTIQLDGSASYDPDGDPITFQWIQEGGSTQVTLANPTTSRPSFTAAAGQSYTFRLVVKDDHGGQGQARVRISTRAADRAQILFFTADPKQTIAGQSVTLSWRTLNADTANIAGIGNVAVNGSLSVSPRQTTTYTLTARNNVNDESSSVTVSVIAVPTDVFLFGCAATPSTISAGQSSTLSWTSANADSVSISPGIGAVPKTGTFAVTPAQTTTYTVTATGGGKTTSCSIAVTVGSPLPVIASFTATPSPIDAGQSSTLQWSVQNADSVSISSLGTVSASGTRSVSPTATTVYTLTATNASGSATRTATVEIRAGGSGPTVVFPSDFVYTTVRDLKLDASGSFSPSGNNPLSFYWTVRGDKATIYQRTSPTPNVFLPGNTGNYIFDVTVTDSKGNSTTKTLTVRLIGL
ncbi:MAG: OmpA/MotB domain protein [Bryobacterales bacterium]|nr:OmpA/MotB domain protein [Bryobacterales bacterium]